MYPRSKKLRKPSKHRVYQLHVWITLSKVANSMSAPIPTNKHLHEKRLRHARQSRQPHRPRRMHVTLACVTSLWRHYARRHGDVRQSFVNIGSRALLSWTSTLSLIGTIDHPEMSRPRGQHKTTTLYTPDWWRHCAPYQDASLSRLDAWATANTWPTTWPNMANDRRCNQRCSVHVQRWTNRCAVCCC